MEKNTNLKKILLNDFICQWNDIKLDAIHTFERVGDSGWLILGNEVTEFENSLGNFWGIKNAIGCANGLDALEIALKVLGIKTGDKVITTPLSAFATTLAIIKAGGIPVFIDVDHSGLINLDLVEIYLNQNPGIKYILPVHLYGHSLDLEQLYYLKNKYNLYVIEDCAQAIGARWNSKKVGSESQVCGTSFYPTKNLGCMGDGGAVLTNDDHIAQKARTLRDYGQSSKYVHTDIGLNSRLDELQAALLRSVFLSRLEIYTRRREEIASCYREAIYNDKIIIPTVSSKSKSVWHLFPVLIKDNRNDFIKYLETKNIQSGVHYPVLISDQEALKKYTGSIEVGELENARYFASHEVSLPIHPYLDDEDIKRIIEACNSW